VSVPDGDYKNIREVIGGCIGLRVVDITQSDADEEGDPFVVIHFENGAILTFPCLEFIFNDPNDEA
jgi:hypothetical protein